MSQCLKCIEQCLICGEGFVDSHSGLSLVSFVFVCVCVTLCLCSDVDWNSHFLMCHGGLSGIGVLHLWSYNFVKFAFNSLHILGPEHNIEIIQSLKLSFVFWFYL